MKLAELVETAGLTWAVAEEQPDGAVVSWIHTTELLDPSRYLSGGEMLLTTGLWRRQRTSAERFVRAIQDAGVAALGYGLPAPNARIPRDVVEACAAAGLPLIEVPFETPFIAISKIFVEATSAAREAWLRRTIARSDQFMRAVREGRGPRGIAEILYAEIGRPLAVFGSTYELLARAGATEEDVDRAASVLRHLDGGSTGEIAHGAQTFAISAAQSRDGYVVVFTDTEIDSGTRATIEQGVAYLGIVIAQRQSLRATELRFIGELVDIAEGGVSRLPELMDRLRSLGLDPTVPLQIIEVSAEHEGAQAFLATVLDDVLRGLSQRGLVVARGASHFLIVENSTGSSEKDPAVRCRDALARHPMCSSAAVGVSYAPDGAADLRRAIREADEAMKVAAGNAGFSIADWADAASHRALLTLADPAIRDHLTGRLVAPLRRQDEARGSELVRTVTLFLSTAGQWQRTADQLHIHVNTLRQRLAKVEELTGTNLSDMSTRVDFFLALSVDVAAPFGGDGLALH